MTEVADNQPAESEQQPSLPSGWRRIILPAIILFALVFTYSVVRYNVIKGVAWEHLPLFISNKAIALGAVVFISVSYLLGNISRFIHTFSRWVYLRKYFGLLGFSLASIHSLMSLALLRPYYYGKFFTAEGSLNLIGELSLLFGVIALFIFSIVAIVSLPSIVNSMDPRKWRSVQRSGYIALVFVLAHVYTMGIQGWLTPEGWPGGLFPISLVAFIILLTVVLIKILAILAGPRLTEQK